MSIAIPIYFNTNGNKTYFSPGCIALIWDVVIMRIHRLAQQHQQLPIVDSSVTNILPKRITSWAR